MGWFDGLFSGGDNYKYADEDQPWLGGSSSGGSGGGFDWGKLIESATTVVGGLRDGTGGRGINSGKPDYSANNILREADNSMNIIIIVLVVILLLRR